MGEAARRINCDPSAAEPQPKAGPRMATNETPEWPRMKRKAPGRTSAPAPRDEDRFKEAGHFEPDSRFQVNSGIRCDHHVSGNLSPRRLRGASHLGGGGPASGGGWPSSGRALATGYHLFLPPGGPLRPAGAVEPGLRPGCPGQLAGLAAPPKPRHPRGTGGGLWVRPPGTDGKGLPEGAGDDSRWGGQVRRTGRYHRKGRRKNRCAPRRRRGEPGEFSQRRRRPGRHGRGRRSKMLRTLAHPARCPISEIPNPLCFSLSRCLRSALAPAAG